MEAETHTGTDFRSVAKAGRIEGAERSVPPVARVASAEPCPVVFDTTFCDRGRQAG